MICQTVPPLVTISTLSTECLGGIGTTTAVGTFASATWPVADTAIFIPFSLSSTFLALVVFIHNGATASGNLDLGIYDAAGTKLTSVGSTAQAGTNALQGVTIPGGGLTLGPGHFYLAAALDNITGTVFRVTLTTAGFLRALGMAEQTTAFPLPAAATFAAVTNAYVPYIGLSGRTLL